MSEIDKQLLAIEEAADSRREPPSFCLNGVWNADPDSADGKYAKKRLLNAIAPRNGYSGFKCPVAGCGNCNYPKNPDYKDEEDTEINDTVYRPVSDKNCKLAGFCLEQAWNAGKDIVYKPLRDAV